MNNWTAEDFETPESHLSDTTKTLTNTSDLGGGWFANQWSDGSMTLRAPDKGQRIDLSRFAVARLKEIMREA